jgi:hypothetical protein
VLAPTSRTDALHAAGLAERALQGKLPNDDWRAGALHVLGTACYRAGEFDGAAEHLSESLRMAPDWIGTYLNWPVLAMAHHRLGDETEAQRWLDKSRAHLEQGKREIAREPIDFPKHLSPGDWLEFLVLHDEAETLCAPTKAGPGK